MASKIEVVPSVDDFTETIDESIKSGYHGSKGRDDFKIAVELNKDATFLGWIKFTESAISADESDPWIPSQEGDDETPATHLAELENGDEITRNLEKAAMRHRDVFLSEVPKFSSFHGLPSPLEEAADSLEEDDSWDVEFTFVLRRRPD